MCNVDVFDSKEAYELYCEKEYGASLAAFKKIDHKLDKLGKSSAFVDYYIGVNLDMLNDPFEAAIYINRSLEKDPYNSNYARSKYIIFENIAEIMEERAVAGAPHSEIQKIYDLIKENGHVTSNVQFKYIRHLMRNKMYEVAGPLIEVELERNPKDPELQNYLKRCSFKVLAAPTSRTKVKS